MPWPSGRWSSASSSRLRPSGRRARRSPWIIARVGVLIAIGVYADHVMVLVVTLTQDFLPSSRLPYAETLWGVATFAGSIGLFLTLLLLFLRYLPAVAITEARRLALAAGPGEPPRSARSSRIPRCAIPAARSVGRRLRRSGASAPPSPRKPTLRPQRARCPAATRRMSTWMRMGPSRCRGCHARSGSRGARSAPTRSSARILGGGAFYGMCVYATAYDYVFLIGGRPRYSWPSFVVPSVSFAMMSGTVAIHLALLVLNRLPRLNHPTFNIPGFLRATDDRYFLSAQAQGDGFDADGIMRQARRAARRWRPTAGCPAGAAMRRLLALLALVPPRGLRRRRHGGAAACEDLGPERLLLAGHDDAPAGRRDRAADGSGEGSGAARRHHRRSARARAGNATASSARRATAPPATVAG